MTYIPIISFSYLLYCTNAFPMRKENIQICPPNPCTPWARTQLSSQTLIGNKTNRNETRAKIMRHIWLKSYIRVYFPCSVCNESPLELIAYCYCFLMLLKPCQIKLVYSNYPVEKKGCGSVLLIQNPT